MQNADVLFVAGRLSLDFVNTSCQDPEVELLSTPPRLRNWLSRAGNLYGEALCPDDSVWTDEYGERMLTRAISLRTALIQLTYNLLHQEAAVPSALRSVNMVLRANPTCLQVHGTHHFTATPIALLPNETWLVRIAEDAVDLLTHGELNFIKQCECETCGRVFYDSTKNHKRRWCVEKCGSKPKAAAYYRRKKARLAAERAVREPLQEAELP